MVPDRQKIKEASYRSWNWVKKKTFNPVPFYKRSWEILRRDPLVFLWKLIADLISRSGTFAVFTFVLSLLIFDFQLFLEEGNPWHAWIDRFADLSVSPYFIAGFAGTVFFTTLLGTTLQAFVVGGIWGLLAAGLRGEPIHRGSTFLAHTWRHFPNVLALFLIRLAVRTVTICLGIAILFAIFHGYTQGSLSNLSTFLQSFVIAGSLAFFIGWFAITRLTLEVIGAPLIIDKMSLGEAILEGAAFVVENFWAMYRLLIFSLGLLLIPLFGYWLLLMLNNLTLIWPILLPLGAVLRLGAEIFLWVSISVLGVLFYGAIFAFYRRDDASIEADAVNEAASFSEGSEKSIRAAGREGQASGSFDRPLSLDELLPEDSPNRFTYKTLFPENQAAVTDGDSEVENEKKEPHTQEKLPPSEPISPSLDSSPEDGEGPQNKPPGETKE